MYSFTKTTSARYCTHFFPSGKEYIWICFTHALTVHCTTLVFNLTQHQVSSVPLVERQIIGTDNVLDKVQHTDISTQMDF